MLDEVQNDWNALDNKKEIDIIKKYTHFANVFSITLTRKLRKNI